MGVGKMKILSGKLDIMFKMNELIDKAESLGCRVILTYDKRICFNTNYEIFIPPIADLENMYALAHEMGHLIDYLEGTLDYNVWLDNRQYRINAEMKAWVNAYSLLKEIDVPFVNWEKHVQEKLFTYFEFDEVS